MIKDINLGDRVVCLSPDGAHTSIGSVTWKSERYKKPCVEIKTQQNLSIVAAYTHPMRTWDSWTPCDDLKVGDRIASLKKGGVFTGTSDIADDLVKFAAYMIGDGYFSAHGCGFTQKDDSCLCEFEEIVDKRGWYYRSTLVKEDSRIFQLNFSNAPGAYPKVLFEEWGIAGNKSGDHCFPDWVWDLDKRKSTLFLNRLWATDGSIRIDGCRYELNYCSVSKRLIKEVQRLLWKFGIPSRIRINVPTLYKNTDKVAYILRIQTQPGVKKFLEDIGAKGKSEGVVIGDIEANNNKDTYPIEIGEDIKRIDDGLDKTSSRGRFATRSLHAVGLHRTLSYPLSKDRFRRYIAYFREHSETNREEVEKLAQHLDTDIYWDKINSIEDIGEQWCYDIAVSNGESFVVDGLITHNSTLLGNKAIAYSGLNLAFKNLYVSATATQAKVFSVDRIKEPIEISPELTFMVDSRLNQNVLTKQFKNRSQIRIRYAFLNADRCRGLSADQILIDEIQDILFFNIPVIEQCASHSAWKLFTYSGTPKSLDNTIEKYWADFSTQNEWVVPCEACGSAKDKSTWFWNVLGIKNIGKKGLICAKCGRPISAYHPDAQWASMQPVTEQNVDRVTFEGYRVSQLMVPWIDWKYDIIMNLEIYDAAKFHNEVLGLSYDSGTRPLTQAQVKACCTDTIHFNDVLENAKKCNGGVFAGLDHGTGEASSYTVLSLGGYLEGVFTIFFVHRFIGEDLEIRLQLEKIAALLTAVNFSICGSDYGGGFDRNDWLIRNFGPLKIVKFAYAGNPKYKIRWQPNLGRFIVHRTEIMSDIFNTVKYRKIRLPKWEEFRTPYAADILNIFSEYNEQIRMTQYKNSPGKADDTFHSILYCFLASMVVVPRPDIIIPVREGSVSFTIPSIHG
jgi:intein/homing endonuclease